MRGIIRSGSPTPRVKRRLGVSLFAAALAVPALVLTQSAPVAAAPAAYKGAERPMTAALAARLSENVNRPVIVILRSQLAAAHVGSKAAVVRSHTISLSQAPLISELHEVHATHIKPYRLVNSFAATVSAGEAAWLRANPTVAEVIPDVIIHGASPTQATSGATASTAKAVTAKAVKSSVKGHVVTSLTPNVIPGACSSGTPQLDPEGLSTTNTDSTNPAQKTARSLGITGSGVKVAWIADGVDTQNINFIRGNGTSAFVDYKDFTGDGPGQITGGDEAFLDSNTVGGQGLHTYNVQNL